MNKDKVIMKVARWICHFLCLLPRELQHHPLDVIKRLTYFDKTKVEHHRLEPE
jgi:hypothetical protein